MSTPLQQGSDSPPVLDNTVDYSVTINDFGQQQPKTASSDTVRRELDRVARQLEGLSKSLKRLKETA